MYRKLQPWMLDGHPGNITRACKRAVVRAHNAGLIVTSTCEGHPGDGIHAIGSLHYLKPPWRRKGHAIDLGTPASLPHRQALARKRAFQAAELARGAWRYRELFGPLNDACVKNGQRISLVNHSPIEDQHDTHVHVAPVI